MNILFVSLVPILGCHYLCKTRHHSVKGLERLQVSMAYGVHHVGWCAARGHLYELWWHTTVGRSSLTARVGTSIEARLSACMIMKTIREEFPKIRGPDIDQKWQGACFEDTHKRNEETARKLSGMPNGRTSGNAQPGGVRRVCIQQQCVLVGAWATVQVHRFLQGFKTQHKHKDPTN